MRIKFIAILSLIFFSVMNAQTTKISLAEWSLHRAIQSGKISNLDFPRIARTEFNIGAVEYVNVLFGDKKNVEDSTYMNKLKNECLKYNVVSNLIMVDREGNLGDTSSVKRDEAVKKHYKWVKAAAFLGCRSIRVNAAGDGTPEQVKNAVVDGLQKLCDFAMNYDVSIIVENHWGYSSDPDWLVEVMQNVNRKNCGLLPDFGNFDQIDRYEAVKKMMPYAKGVSAKTYEFDSKGLETKIDYKKMMKIVHDSGYRDYVGIEYEGDGMTEEEGIKATIELLNKN